MKGREVREALNGKADPTLVHCVASVAEEVSALNQELTAISQLMNQMIDVTAGLADTIEEFKMIANKLPDKGN